jgi:gliding motility-associated-like protein
MQKFTIYNLGQLTFESLRINPSRLLNNSIVILLCFISKIAFSQGLCDSPTGSVAGNFVLSKASICLGETVTITDNSGGTDVKYVYDYRGEKLADLPLIGATASKTNTYVVAGTYRVLQYGKKGGQDMYACRTMVVLGSNEPVFTTSACNQLLSIIIPQNPQNLFDSYRIDWGDGFVETIPQGTALPLRKNRTYSLPAASRNIKVEGLFNTPNGCPSATFKNVPMDGGTNYPNITKVEMSADSKTADVTFTGAVDDYDIYMRSGTGSYTNGQFLMKAKPGTYKINLVDTVQSCFKLYRNFGCKEGSGEVCTTKMDVKALDKSNIISWQNHPSGNVSITYDVQVVTRTVTSSIKKTEVGGSTSTINSPGNPHTDPIDCSKDFCYQVEQRVSGTIDYGRFNYTSISLSPKKCISRKDVVPDKITESIVSVNNNNKVEITIQDNSPWTLRREKYIIYKKEDNGKFTEIDNSTTPKTIIDNSVDASTKVFCYKIGFVDECKSESALSPELCTVHLKENQAGNIEWTNLSPFGQGTVASYEIEAYNEANNTPAKVATNQPTQLSYIPILDGFEEEAKYRIKTISNSSKESYSNTISIPIKVNLLVPNAFTPDNNSFNDELKVYGNLKRVSDFDMRIYNRWGINIHTITDVNSTWDGKVDNQELPPGIYFYTAKAVLKNGELIEKKGSLLLIR